MTSTSPALSGYVAGAQHGAPRDTRRMKAMSVPPCYKRHRFSPEIIAHAVWLYFRVALNYCAYGPIAAHFRPRRHRLPAADYRQQRRQCFQTWHEASGVRVAI